MFNIKKYIMIKLTKANKLIINYYLPKWITKNG